MSSPFGDGARRLLIADRREPDGSAADAPAGLIGKERRHPIEPHIEALGDLHRTSCTKRFVEQRCCSLASLSLNRGQGDLGAIALKRFRITRHDVNPLVTVPRISE